MATTILYRPQGVTFSSALPDITVSTDAATLDVRLSCDGTTTLLSERYHATNGAVTLHDLGTLIESDLRSRGISFAKYRLQAGNDSVTIPVLHCDRYVTPSDTSEYLRQNFLTTNDLRRIAPGATIELHLLLLPGDSPSYIIDTGTSQLTFNQETTITEPTLHTITIKADSIPEATSFTVRCGQRSVSYFIDSSLATAQQFQFRNCFNVWDTALIPCQTTAKTTVERATATIGGQLRFYNQTAEQTFQIETAPLTSDEAAWLDQLITSHEVIRIERDQVTENLCSVPVLITDATHEITDTPDRPNTVKFTWRYAATRPRLHLTASPSIFTTPFNPVYT